MRRTEVTASVSCWVLSQVCIAVKQSWFKSKPEAAWRSVRKRRVGLMKCTVTVSEHSSLHPAEAAAPGQRSASASVRAGVVFSL